MPPRSPLRVVRCPPRGPLRLRSGEASPAALAGLVGESPFFGAGWLVGKGLLGGESGND
mgnify:CR=1 FL=1